MQRQAKTEKQAAWWKEKCLSCGAELKAGDNASGTDYWVLED
jgi:hypothetical protein